MDPTPRRGNRWDVAFTLCAALSFASAAVADSASRSVIDAHVHLITTTNGLTYEWAKPPGSLQPPQKCPCRPPCLCNWTAADYRATSASSWNVDKVVFCEVDAEPSEWLAEARWVQKMEDARKKEDALTAGPEIGAIVARPPPGFGIAPVSNYSDQLDELMKLPLVTGLRPSGLDPNTTTEFELAALREAGKRNLVIDLNMPITTGVVEKIVRGCPETRFVLEHLGGAKTTSTDPSDLQKWTDAIRSLAKLPNIECLQLGGVASAWGNTGKLNVDAISAWVVGGIDAFGFNRVCFEGNWFFNNWGPPHANLEVYGLWADTLMSIFKKVGATEEQIDSALRVNSARVYRIQSS